MASYPGSVEFERAFDGPPDAAAEDADLPGDAAGTMHAFANDAPRSTDTQLAGLWARVRERLQGDVGEVEFRMWLRPMTLGGLDGDEVTLLLPTRFLRDWVRGHYADKLNELWQQEDKRVRRVDIRVGGAAAPVAEAPELAPVTTLPRAAPVPRPAAAADAKRRWTHASSSTASSSASRTSLLMHAPAGWRNARAVPASTLCSCMAASASARRI